jgi:hypothetical protein
MNKPSTPILVAAIALSAFAPLASATNYPITPQQRAVADKVAQAGVPLSELAPDAPDSYTIVRGDTLWDISSKFLKSPWRWPELWGMNKNQIRNPHLIYPGQILFLEKIGDRAQLRVGEPVDGVVRLSPHVRTEDLLSAIPSIPASAIEPFLSKPLIVEEDGLNAAPRVVATQEGRVFTGVGDTVYVRGIDSASKIGSYQFYRPGRALRDPDTNAIVAYEAVYLGVGVETRPGDPATFRLTEAREEIGVGDRLVAAVKTESVNYVPRAADKDIDGRVLSIYGGGVNQAATNMVVSLNRGTAQGVEPGQVFRLYRYGSVITDTTSTVRDEMVKLPDEPTGYLFVFRVFNNISYGLILNATNTVTVGDRFSSKLE